MKNVKSKAGDGFETKIKRVNECRELCCCHRGKPRRGFQREDVETAEERASRGCTGTRNERPIWDPCSSPRTLSRLWQPPTQGTTLPPRARSLNLSATLCPSCHAICLRLSLPYQDWHLPIRAGTRFGTCTSPYCNV